MARYRVIDGETIRIDKPEQQESPSAFVIDDTFSTPLRHPVTGEIYDSYSNYMKTNKRLNLDVVGNDLLSKRRDNKREVITESMVMDKMAKAESIISDPAKYREYRNMNERLFERNEKLLKGR